MRDELQALARTLPAKSRFEWRMEGEALHLAYLGIPVQHRGRGTASRFLASVLQVADGQGVEVTLDADPTLEPGDPSLGDLVRLYRRFGFVPLGLDDQGWMMMSRTARVPPVHASVLLGEAEAARLVEPARQDVQSWVNRLARGEADAPYPGTEASLPNPP